ncbi:MAG: peptidase domain-containing ABC transporter [Caulobacter sp.]|nr:peptidase domain-containing ABC transporter [Vitreoscilla sp.]
MQHDPVPAGVTRRLGLRRGLPVILQTQATECGLACLAMVAVSLGLDTDLPSLRLRFGLSRKGANFEGLVRVAAALGLASRPLKLDLHNLRELQLPCILHWDMNHFVVLKSVSARRLVIHDPRVGARTLTVDEFAPHFTGIALELSPGEGFAPRSERLHFTLRGLMGRITGLNRGLAQILALALALEVVVIALPFYLQWVVDQALLAADRELLGVLALGFGLLVLLQAGIGAVRSWWVATLSARLNFQWLGNVFGHLVRLPLEFFEKRHVGHIVSCFGSIEVIQKTLTTGLVQALVDGLMVAGTLAMMGLYSPVLMAVSLVAAGLYGLLRWSVFRGLREASAEEIIHAARQQTHFLETAGGIQSVRLFGRGDQRRAGWMNMLADQFNAGLRVARVHVAHESAQTLLFGLERVIVVWLAARMVLAGGFTVGMLFAYLAYKELFSAGVGALVDTASELAVLRLHGERVPDIALAPTEPGEAPSPIEMDLGRRPARIGLRGVGYRYAPTEPWVLRGVDLVVEEGRSLAITGPSGCGKTTLVKVLLGLLPPTEGEVLFDGTPIHRLGLSHYRALIGTVMQEDRLFSGSVADNICFFDAEPDLDWIEECARLAAVDTEIRAMTMGFHTLVTDVGTGLSGGQKQRVLLARALYRRPRILVLDEATSHLDLRNERSVNEAVRSMALTRVVVAHRPETIAVADRVVTLADGRVASDSAASRHTAD